MIKITMRDGKILDKIFEWGVGIKGFFGIFELLGGVLFTFSGHKIFYNIIISMAQQEIIEDPDDFFANYLLQAAGNFSINSQIFASLYLIFHGVINVWLAVSLFKKKIWAYPWAVGLSAVFIIYQIYKYFHSFSVVLLLLIIFDILFACVIWIEYLRKKRAL